MDAKNGDRATAFGCVEDWRGSRPSAEEQLAASARAEEQRAASASAEEHKAASERQALRCAFSAPGL